MVKRLESGLSKLVPGHFSNFEAGGKFLVWGRDEGSCSIREGYGMNILFADL